MIITSMNSSKAGATPGSFEEYKRLTWRRTWWRFVVKRVALFFTLLAFLLPIAEQVFGAEKLFEAPLGVERVYWVIGLYLVVLFAILLWSILSARRVVSDLKAKSFSLGGGKSIDILIGSFWQSVDRARSLNYKYVIAFGVHDRLTSAPLKKSSLHAEFREQHLGAYSRESEDYEVTRAKKLFPSMAARGGQLPFGTVIPIPYPIHAQNGVSHVERNEADAGRAYLFVNSTLEPKTVECEPNNFHSRISGDGSDATTLSNNFRGLFDTIQNDGHSANTLVVPLLGTGYSSSASPTAAVFHLIDAYFHYLLYTDRGATKLSRMVISLMPVNVTEGQVDLKAVHDYVEARSKIYDRMR